MYLSLRKKVETIAAENDITFQELADIIGLDELTLLYFLEDGNELPVVYLAKMSQVLNFNFFSLFRFNSEKGNIDVTDQAEADSEVSVNDSASDARELGEIMNNLVGYPTTIPI